MHYEPFILFSTTESPINAYDFIQRNSTDPVSLDDLKETRGWSAEPSSDHRDSVNTQGDGRFISRRLINVGLNDQSSESTVIELEDV